MIDAATARRHALTGLAVALVVGVGFAWWLLAEARSAAAEYGGSRGAVVIARSLADVVERAGYQGDAVRKAVAAFAKADPRVKSARVVIFEGLTLEASTAASDRGDNAAPRRLMKEEKALYDRGQELKSAIQTNREDQVARKDELQVKPFDDGRFMAAVPLEKPAAEAGQPPDVVGFVQVDTNPMTMSLGLPPVASVVLAIVIPMLLLFGLSLAMKGNRPALTGAAVVLAVGALFFYRAQGVALVEKDRLAAEHTIAASMQEQVKRVSSVIADAGLDTSKPVDASAWDVDSFRKPIGLVNPDGSLNAAQVEAAQARARAAWTRLMTLVAVITLAIVVFFGIGSAAALWRILVTHREGYSYVAPAMVAMIVLVFFPFFYGIGLSFTGQTIYNSDKSIAATWVGLKNFVDILGDFHIASRGDTGWVVNYQNFYWTLFVTVAWTVSNVAIGVSLGLALALALNTKGLRFRPIYRVLLILPWAVPNYITALIWKGMFHQQFGVVNQFVQMLGLSPVSWFEKPFTSFLTCLATNGWLSFPFMMVISLGALQSIPADLYEAARVDGASRWKQFTSITLPSLKPALVPAVILSVVWTFNMFNIIYLVSAGEPAHSTEILVTQAYKLAFEQYRYGYAAAYSTVIFMILLVYGTWQNRVTKATEGI